MGIPYLVGAPRRGGSKGGNHGGGGAARTLPPRPLPYGRAGGDLNERTRVACDPLTFFSRSAESRDTRAPLEPTGAPQGGTGTCSPSLLSLHVTGRPGGAPLNDDGRVARRPLAFVPSVRPS